MFLRGDALEEILGEELDVFFPAAQRRELQADDIEAVKQVFAECFGLDFRFEVFVCRGDDAHVGADDIVPAHAGEGAVLQDAQQFALHRHRHLADLVEEERAAVRLFEAPDALGAGAGERSLLVTEQLALEEIFRNGRAIDGEERPVVPCAVLVDGVSHEFFARTALAGDHDRGVAVRDAPDHFEHFLHGRRLTDDAVLVLFDRQGRCKLLRALHFGRRLDRRIDDDLQIERQLLLAHEVERAEAHRFDDALRRAQGAGDDDQGVRIALAQPREQLEPAVRAEPHLRDGDERFLRAEHTEGVLRGFRGDDVHVIRAQLRLGPVEKIGIGIRDEDFLLCAHNPFRWRRNGGCVEHIPASRRKDPPWRSPARASV